MSVYVHENIVLNTRICKKIEFRMTKIGNNSKIGEREREREEESLEFTVMWPMKVGCYNERDRKKEREQKGCASTGSES